MRIGEKNLNRKISRITLLIPMITVLLLIGVAATMNITSPSFQSSSPNFKREELDNEIPAGYRIYEILGTEACDCLGNTYSDELPPDYDVRSPPNNSLVLLDTIIDVEFIDNFPAAMVGGVNFVPEYIYYHWNNDTSNTTAYNAGVDDAPEDDDPVKVEISLPNDDAGVTHILYFYAVDYEDNWTSFILIYSTAGVGEESSVTWTTTTTTTTTIPRRTDGFLLIPMLIILIGSVNIITWKKRKKE